MNKDREVIEAMKKYGGSFAKALAVAMMYADSVNYEKIVKNWSEMIEGYRCFIVRDKGETSEKALCDL